jgi:hypothetical protein
MKVGSTADTVHSFEVELEEHSTSELARKQGQHREVLDYVDKKDTVLAVVERFLKRKKEKEKNK